MSARCRSCDAEIMWAKIVKKDGTEGNMPFDPDPVDDGTHMVTESDEEDRFGDPVMRAEWIDPSMRQVTLEEGNLLYQSHFRTCPNADDHRSKRMGSRRR